MTMRKRVAPLLVLGALAVGVACSGAITDEGGKGKPADGVDGGPTSTGTTTSPTDTTTAPSDGGPTPDTTPPPPPPPPPDGGSTSSAGALATKLRGKANFMIGMGNDLADDHNNDGAYTLGPTLDLHYAYLSGLPGAGGWPDWNAGGSFVNLLSDVAVKKGVTPMYTFYQSAAQGDGNTAVVTDDGFMKPYWQGAKLMFQRVAMIGKPTVVHVEPDWWGYCEQKTGGDPKKMPVHVTSLVPECAGLPDDISGMAQCILKLGRTLAPNAVIGFGVSEWGADTPDKVVAFHKALYGSYTPDLAVLETLDRDAGCFEAGTDPECKRTGSFYWDESNAKSPNFHEHLAWAKAIHDGLGLPLMWWQTPFGVPSDTPGGTDGHYRDNRVHYIFNHIKEFVDAGGAGVVFGTGAGKQTYITSDGDQFKKAVTAYFAAPYPLP